MEKTFSMKARPSCSKELTGWMCTAAYISSNSSCSTAADPTMQGVIAILALAVNVIVLAIIIKRAVQQKKNPYKNEIFSDTRDFRQAMARAE